MNFVLIRGFLFCENMDIKLKYGLEQLLFGMKQSNVEALYGKADFQYKDDRITSYNVCYTKLLRILYRVTQSVFLSYLLGIT